jgi:CBS domain-containing protein
LLVAVALAHATTVLLLKRSILTEKISRRGFHVSREYHVDPLEILFVREAMRADVPALPTIAMRSELRHLLAATPRRHRLLTVVDEDQRLRGVITRRHLENWLAEATVPQSIEAVMTTKVSLVYDDEPLRVAAQRMAVTGHTILPVVARADQRVVGMITLADLLAGRRHALDAEQRRERVLTLPFVAAARDVAAL